MVLSGRTDLEDLYCRFAVAVLDRIGDRIALGQMPRLLARRVVFHDASRETSLVAQPSLELFFAMSRGEIWTLPVTRQCAAAHLHHGIFSAQQIGAAAADPTAVQPTLDQMSVHLTHELLKPILQAARESGNPRPPLERILEAYRQFLSAWTGQTARYLLLLPLLNFESEVTALKVGEFFTLSKFSPEDKTELWDRFALDLEGWLSVDSISRASFKLETRHLSKPNDPATLDELGGAHERIITALRLLKGGEVGVATVLQVQEPLGGCQTIQTSQFMIEPLRPIYKLLASEVADLLKLEGQLHLLATTQGMGGLRVGLDRFNSTYARRDLEDRIIDLAIALESCLVREDGRYKQRTMSERAAVLLAQSRKHSDTVQLTKIFYEVRNLIVHRGCSVFQTEVTELLTGLGSPTTWAPDFVSACAGLARDVLKSYVDRVSSGHSVDETNRELDDLLRGRKP